MVRPSSEELNRSGRTALDPDSVGGRLEARRRPSSKGETGPVPEDNRPGHHPEHEQDKPDLDAFAAHLGVLPDVEGAPSGEADLAGSPEGRRDEEARSVPAVVVGTTVRAVAGVAIDLTVLGFRAGRRVCDEGAHALERVRRRWIEP